ncbi:MAG: YceK/YidQ family lipoprotein [Gemmataceae bacterium]
MRQRLLLAMALGWTVVGTGCATALNVQDASLRKPYGGVTMPITDFFGGGESGESAEYSSLFFWPFWLMDKPLSLFADTLTLPYTLNAQRNPQGTSSAP